jgi:hypothetical protein
MADSDNLPDGLKLSDQATLGLLSALEYEQSITQRGLATRIGVALGLTNSLLKRAVHKGLVKVRQAPAKRFVYYVTPKGFGEKSRLVAKYLSSSLSFFRQVKDEYGQVFEIIKSRGIERVVLYGTGELAEIAVLAAHEQGIEVQYIVQKGSNLEQFCGYPVRHNLNDLPDDSIEAVVITSIDESQSVYDKLRAEVSDLIIYSAPLLHITRGINGGANHE